MKGEIVYTTAGPSIKKQDYIGGYIDGDMKYAYPCVRYLQLYDFVFWSDSSDKYIYRAQDSICHSYQALLSRRGYSSLL